VVFNPAPAVELPDDVYQGLGHLIINESEASILSKSTEEISVDSDLSAIASLFINKGVGNVIITLGSHVSRFSPS
jgi:ribokinase